MSTDPVRHLYDLLPAVHRISDVEHGSPLNALLRLVAGQADLVRKDIAGLWDDFFVETCADWIVPYIGDLVGNTPIHGIEQRSRADVARTIFYRRRKGTLPMLERLARDVTGWGSHAVAFFELLGWTQHLNHQRFELAPNPLGIDPEAVDRVGTVHLRNLDALDRLNDPFDAICHTVDVRPICQRDGWYNIRKIGFFLWRLRSYPLAQVLARQSAAQAHGFHFSTLGAPAPLFTRPRPDVDEVGLATELHVPGPIRAIAFYSRPGDYYDPASSFAIWRDGVLVPLAGVMCKELANWERPPAGFVAMDVRRGRMTFAVGEEPMQDVRVNYAYGFSANMGGGPYDRRRAFTTPQEPFLLPDTVADPNALGVLIQVPDPIAGIATIAQALAAWNPAVQRRALIQILDSDTYVENLAVNLVNPLGAELVIQAANQQRPTLVGTITINDGTGLGSFALNGLLVSGAVRVENNVGALFLEHVTLVPGGGLTEDGDPADPDFASVSVDPGNTSLRIQIDRSIVGRLRVPEDAVSVQLRDSILDAVPRDRPARVFPVLVSGNLAPFPALSSATPTLAVSIGGVGPIDVTLAAVPATLADARNELQAAIRGANTSPGFAQARVVVVGNRLAVLPGTRHVVRIAAAAGDPTATELALDATAARATFALVGGPLNPYVPPTSAAPTVLATMGTLGPQRAVFALVPPTLAQARDQLQIAVRAAHANAAFSSALAALADFQLVLIPGVAAVVPVLTPQPGDPTLRQLALASDRPALAGSDGGELPGPPATLIRTTVFGEVHVRELTLASEVIFTGIVRADRRQSGCVRFSFVARGSQTPRRFRCQPDLEIEARLDEARRVAAQSGVPWTAARESAVRDDVFGWLVPAFTSLQYGLPGYAQLLLASPGQIRRGAEDGSEMGAFSHLKQPQREKNLKIRLEEYLPFGLEPGLIFVS